MARSVVLCAGRELFPSSYSHAEISRSGRTVPVVGQDVAAPAKPERLCLLFADGSRSWYAIANVRPIERVETPHTSTGSRGWIVAELHPQHGCAPSPEMIARFMARPVGS